jgi:hypothetical protein
MNSDAINPVRTLKAVLFAAVLGSGAGWATEADAAKSYFCKATIAADADHGPVSLSGPLVYDLGTVGSCTDVEFATRFQNNCATPANSACSTKANGDSNFNSAAFWCAKGVPNGATIRAYVGVGPPNAPKGRYNTAQTKGVLINKPAVVATTCTCPSGWEAHEYPAGHKDGRCFKLACGPSAVRPFPEGPIGDNNAWGFTWGNGSFYAWGNAANGGAPKCETHITSPAECRWQ